MPQEHAPRDKVSASSTRPPWAEPQAIEAYSPGQALDIIGSRAKLREASGAPPGSIPIASLRRGLRRHSQSLARAFRKMATSYPHTHGFCYPIATLGAGATLWPRRTHTRRCRAILAKVLSAPGGFSRKPEQSDRTYIRREAAAALGLPKHVLLVIDARYAEYVRRNDTILIELVLTSENFGCAHVLQIYGLAGLRLGWLYGPAHVVDAVNRIRGPFNVGAPSIAAGVAAIKDAAHVERARAHNEKWLAWTIEEITRLGLKVTPSVGNFILIHFPETKGKTAAEQTRCSRRAAPCCAP